MGLEPVPMLPPGVPIPPIFPGVAPIFGASWLLIGAELLGYENADEPGAGAGNDDPGIPACGVMPVLNEPVWGADPSFWMPGELWTFIACLFSEGG